MHRPTIILLLFLVIPSLSSAQRPNFPGLRAAAEEKYKVWWREHLNFEELFLSKLRPALSGDEPATKIFCSQSFKDKIDFLYGEAGGKPAGLFVEQLEAQKFLYQLETKEAQKDSSDLGSLLAGQDDLEKQRQTQLSNAKQERQFLQIQKTQLEAEQNKKGSRPDQQTVQQGSRVKDTTKSASTPDIRASGAAPVSATNSIKQEATEQASIPGPSQSTTVANAPDVSADSSTSTPSSKMITNLDKALSELDATIQLLDEKVRTLEDVGPVNVQTKESLASALKQAYAKTRQMREWDSLLDAQGEYWRSYYAMRSAQFRELCPPPPPPGPLIAPRRPIQ